MPRAVCYSYYSRVMTDQHRVFSNITREVMYKLLWHHGYVEKNKKGEYYDPRPLPKYADLKAEVTAAQKDRLRR